MGLRLPLDGRLNKPLAAPTLADRVRLVLETRPGQVPWRPELGCDLEPLLGKTLTPERLSDARWRIQAALEDFLPGVSVSRIDIHVRSDLGADMSNRRLPVAEASLVPYGAHGALEIDLELQTRTGPVRLHMEVPS